MIHFKRLLSVKLAIDWVGNFFKHYFVEGSHRIKKKIHRKLKKNTVIIIYFDFDAIVSSQDRMTSVVSDSNLIIAIFLVVFNACCGVVPLVPE